MNNYNNKSAVAANSPLLFIYVSITRNHMKSLILLSFLLTAGIISITHAQVDQSSKNDAMRASTRNTIEFLFPDFQQDIAKLQAKENKSKPDPSVISTSFESRVFTNYKAPGASKSSVARSLPSPPDKASTPSDISAREAADKQKTAHKVPPMEIPSQGNETNNVPVKKKS